MEENPFHVYLVFENKLYSGKRYHPILANFLISNKLQSAVVDSGAAVSLINIRLVNVMGLHVQPYSVITVKCVTGQLVQPAGVVNLTISLAGCTVPVQLQVTDAFERPLLIGNDLHIKTDFVIDYANKSVHRFDVRDGTAFLS